MSRSRAPLSPDPKVNRRRRAKRRYWKRRFYGDSAFRAEEIRRRKLYHFKRKYGITYEATVEMRRLQGNRCAVCLKPFPDEPKGTEVHVDHIEVDGKKIVRGITHPTCNQGLGKLGDDVAGLTRALMYVSGVVAPEYLIDEHW